MKIKTAITIKDIKRAARLYNEIIENSEDKESAGFLFAGAFYAFYLSSYISKEAADHYEKQLKDFINALMNEIEKLEDSDD